MAAERRKESKLEKFQNGCGADLETFSARSRQEVPAKTTNPVLCIDAIGRTYLPAVLRRPGAMNAMYTICITIKQQEAERRG